MKKTAIEIWCFDILSFFLVFHGVLIFWHIVLNIDFVLYHVLNIEKVSAGDNNKTSNYIFTDTIN